MAIPGITYRLEKGVSLTHTEMDNNFRSIFYSSSIHDNGATLRLHYDTAGGDYAAIPLNAGSGSVSITGNVDNRVVTATGTPGLIQGEPNMLFDGLALTLSGVVDLDDGANNVIIGTSAGAGLTGAASSSVTIGYQAGQTLIGDNNTVIGAGSAVGTATSTRLVALGFQALANLSSGNSNVSIGTDAGENLTSGASNVHLGNAAGPAGATGESNKLYINNLASDTPLILGDFSTGQLTINSQVSASIFSGSFAGDGSLLTGLVLPTGSWNGLLDGNAQISGSLTVSGSNIDFTNTTAISGSIFSGSFVGDGSGLTGITATVFPFTGSAAITGSLPLVGPLSVIGTSTLQGITIIDTNIRVSNPHITSIGIGECAYVSQTGTNSFSVGIGRYAACAAIAGCHVAIGNEAGSRISIGDTYVGYFAGRCTTGTYNTAFGESALSNVGAGAENVAIGSKAMCNNTQGFGNTAIGLCSLKSNSTGTYNTAIGRNSLSSIIGAATHRNTGLGNGAGETLSSGCNNIYIGYKAGPSLSTVQSNKLYINNQSGTPLIGGDFSTNSVSISGSLVVSQSITATTYFGDGSNLTGFEWDGSHTGSASISGSLTVDGPTIITGSLTVTGNTVLTSVSASIFSGSFVGDGSGLTNVTAEWDGSRNGDANITGSLIVSGGLDVAGPITIASTAGYPTGPGVEFIHYATSSLSGVNNIYTFPISSSNGYTGFKADYVITDTTEASKKVGTLLGGWDQAGASTVNDSYTYATGGITATSFDIDASAVTSATLVVSASTGPYELNMLITAFKRSI